MELDMRISPKLGRELRDEIHANVMATQKFLITQLPGWLILSHKQFVSLLDYTTEMYQTKDRMFITPHNVMEVVVDEDLDPVSPEQAGINPEDIELPPAVLESMKHDSVVFSKADEDHI